MLMKLCFSFIYKKTFDGEGFDFDFVVYIFIDCSLFSIRLSLIENLNIIYRLRMC